MTVFRNLWRNQIRQWLKEGCRKPVLGVRLCIWSKSLMSSCTVTDAWLFLFCFVFSSVKQQQQQQKNTLPSWGPHGTRRNLGVSTKQQTLFSLPLTRVHGQDKHPKTGTTANSKLTSSFFVGAQTVVSLLQTTQITSHVCFYNWPCCLRKPHETKIIWIEKIFFNFF